jgi:antitoxin CptB
MNELSRLRWRCRRGVREMDLLLERFLETAWPGLGAAERSAFERLLDEPDPDLYAWITGREEPREPAYLPIIERLREGWPVISGP